MSNYTAGNVVEGNQEVKQMKFFKLLDIQKKGMHFSILFISTRDKIAMNMKKKKKKKWIFSFNLLFRIRYT